MRHPYSLACVSVVVAVAWAVPVAASAFGVDGQITQGTQDPVHLKEFQLSAPIGIGQGVRHDEAYPNLYSFHGQAEALAGRDGLHAHSYNQIIKYSAAGTSSFAGSYSSMANASALFTDVIITGNTSTVSASLNFHMAGSQLVDSTASTIGYQARVQSTVSFQLRVDDHNGVTLDHDGGYHTIASVNSDAAPTYESGLLTGFDGNLSITTKQMTLPVNTPFSIFLALGAQSSDEFTFREPAFIVAANTDIGNTLTFATDRPVFNLPSGYTVNSPSAGIIENQYTVPEPFTATLLVAGLFILLFDRRQRRNEVAVPVQ